MTAAAALTVSGCAPAQNGTTGGGSTAGGGAGQATEDDNGTATGGAAAEDATGEPVRVGIIYSETEGEKSDGS